MRLLVAVPANARAQGADPNAMTSGSGSPEERWAREDEERARAYREQRRTEMGLTEAEMCQREAYLELKKEVHVLATQVAESVTLDTRSYNLWLMQVKGYPRRDQCKWQDLKKLKRYLMSPEAREEARAVPQAAPPRWGRASARSLPDE
jgi:hypothetical protein